MNTENLQPPPSYDSTGYQRVELSPSYAPYPDIAPSAPPMDPPQYIGAVGTAEQVIRTTIEKRDRAPEGSVLSQLMNNAEATITLAKNAMAYAGTRSADFVLKGNPYLFVPKFIAAAVGFSLFSGSLLLSVAVKAAIWIPVMSAAFIGAGTGAVIGGMCTGTKEGFDKGFKIGGDIVGGTLAPAFALVSAALVIPRGITHLIGSLGYLILTALGDEKDRQTNDVMCTALFQSVQDSYLLFGAGSALNNIGSLEDTGRSSEEFFADLNFLIENGLNVYEKSLLDGSFIMQYGQEVYKDPLLSEKPLNMQGILLGDRLYGQGTATDEVGVIAKGLFVKSELDGYGELRRSDGSILRGTFKKGKIQSGQQILIEDDREVYKTTYENGKLVKIEGTYIRRDNHPGYNGVTYNGSFTINEKGRADGTGKIIRKDGCTIEGTFVNGVLEGDGIEAYPDGTILKGIFKKGKLQSGTKTLRKNDHKPIYELTYENGKLVQIEGEYEQEPTIKGRRGTTYRGSFTLSEENGEIQVSGTGKISFCEGGMQEGTFVNGFLEGEGSEYLGDGSGLRKGIFKHGEFVERK